MNQDLIRFIELCLADGIISDKEKEVIFRKAAEYGVPQDECEIIVESMIQQVESKSSNTPKEESQKSQTPIDVDFDDDYPSYKQWFSNWIKRNQKIEQLRGEKATIIKDAILTQLDGSEGFGSVAGEHILKETLLGMCELENIASSFWSSTSKKGSVENKFKEQIKSVLNAEKFICYFSSSKISISGTSYPTPWGDKDLKQMIEHYNNPNKDLGNEGWYSFKKNPYSIIMDRVSVLITDKSIIELIEKTKYEDYALNRMKLDDVTESIFTDNFGNFDMSYRPIEGILKCPGFNITHLKPEPLPRESQSFIEIIKSLGLTDQTKRLINVDEKIHDFIDSKYNSQLSKLENKEFFYFGFKSKKSIIGMDKLVMVENSIIRSLHPLSLELFNIYMRLITFRDSLLKLYLSGNQVELESILMKFENSELGLSKFESSTLTALESINSNLVELKEINQKGFNDLSEKMDDVITGLDDINDSNHEILHELKFNNFIDVVQLYYTRKIATT
mgnify:CR=1 FL=1|jgi:hypothetical protein